MLGDGDQVIQSFIYDYFIENVDTENFFKRISVFIKQEIQICSNGVNREQLFHQISEFKYVFTDEHKNNSIQPVLRFLQLLCEGHNSNMQQYLSEQTSSKQSYNLVYQTVELLKALSSKLTTDSYEKILQCFDTLTEYI